MEKPYASIDEAMQRIGVGRSTILRMLADGRLTGHQLKPKTGRWCIHHDSIEQQRRLRVEELVEGGAA